MRDVKLTVPAVKNAQVYCTGNCALWKERSRSK